MTEDERTPPGGREPAVTPRPTTDGPADLTYGAAGTDDSDELGPSPVVHGEEGGGDPAAGAQADTTGENPEDRPRGFTP